MRHASEPLSGIVTLPNPLSLQEVAERSFRESPSQKAGKKPDLRRSTTAGWVVFGGRLVCHSDRSEESRFLLVPDKTWITHFVRQDKNRDSSLFRLAFSVAARKNAVVKLLSHHLPGPNRSSRGTAMTSGLKFTGLLVASILCLPVGLGATTRVTHHLRQTKKELPPLPSGPRGPVQQVPLDSMAPVAPQVTFEHEQLTIIAPNSTLGDILRAVRKRTGAEIDIPASATERVVTRLGPGPAREVMADLLNGSRFNYVLLGSPQDANLLTRIVLVAKTGPDTVPSARPPQPKQAEASDAQPEDSGDASQDAAQADDSAAADDNAATDENADQSNADADQNPPEPGVKTPQQLLQEMQQRQLLLQQQQNPGHPIVPGQFPGYPGTPQNPQQQDQPQDQ